MPSFFSSSPKTPSKKHTPVFAGLDDPFNFPSAKMRYNAHPVPRTSSPDSATHSLDSGYASVDDDPLSPKTQIATKDRRRLLKDGKGHWRMQNYEHQSEGKCKDETERVLDNEAQEKGTREWRPDPKRTFTGICGDAEKKKDEEEEGKWYTKRIYAKALQQRDRNEGVTRLQRSMAPVLRHPVPSPSLALQSGARKGNTPLRSSPPTPTPSLITPTHIDQTPTNRGRGRGRGRGRDRSQSPNRPSTRLPLPLPPHSSPYFSSPRSSSLECNIQDRSPTPLPRPTSSETQSAPTPLRLRRSSCRTSVGDGEQNGTLSLDTVSLGNAESDSDSIGSFAGQDSESGSGSGSESESEIGVILARTGMVGRAQRVKVRSPGLKRSAV